MKELVCIVCPNGCKIIIDDNGDILNAKCNRGIVFATEETTCPKRTVCSTVATTFSDFPVLPVRSSAEIKKIDIPACMNALNNVLLDRRVGRGEIIIKDVLGSGVDIISTSSMQYTYCDVETPDDRAKDNA